MSHFRGDTPAGDPLGVPNPRRYPGSHSPLVLGVTHGSDTRRALLPVARAPGWEPTTRLARNEVQPARCPQRAARGGRPTTGGPTTGTIKRVVPAVLRPLGTPTSSLLPASRTEIDDNPLDRGPTSGSSRPPAARGSPPCPIAAVRG